MMLTTQKMKISFKDIFNKCDPIRKKLWIWSPFTEEIINGKVLFFCAMAVDHRNIYITRYIIFRYVNLSLILSLPVPR